MGIVKSLFEAFKAYCGAWSFTKGKPQAKNSYIHKYRLPKEFRKKCLNILVHGPNEIFATSKNLPLWRSANRHPHSLPEPITSTPLQPHCDEMQLWDVSPVYPGPVKSSSKVVKHGAPFIICRTKVIAPFELRCAHLYHISGHKRESRNSGPKKPPEKTRILFNAQGLCSRYQNAPNGMLGCYSTAFPKNKVQMYRNSTKYAIASTIFRKAIHKAFRNQVVFMRHTHE